MTEPAQEFIYDPYKWLPSLFRSLKEYIEGGIDKSVKHFTDDIGLQVYEVIFDFPASRLAPDKLPFRNGDGNAVTLIHLVIDNIDNRPLGFGSGEFKESIYAGQGGDYIVSEEAEAHEITFDVGIWASDESGGSSSRLDAYQALDSILSGPSAQEACESATGGIQIMSFAGARFFTEAVNDIRVYRVADIELVTFVYSSKLVLPSALYEIVQNPEMMIDETVIVDVTP